MRFLKKRSIIGIISIALAFILVFVATPMIRASENQDVQIIRVTKNIPEGTAITKEMVETVQVGGHNLPSGVLREEKDVVGKFTTAALQPGDYILSTKTSEKSQSAYLTQMDGSRQAVSISIKSFAAGLSGKLESGDIISLVVTGYGDSKQTFAPQELRYIKLLAATTDKGMDTDQVKDADNKDKDDNIPSTLTLLVTPEQRTNLVDYENNGKLYASLVYRGSAQEAKKFLDMEDQFLAADMDKAKDAQKQIPSGGTGGVVSNGQ